MMDEYNNNLDINDPETIARFDGMYVDFYLEDDIFEVEGQFFTVDDLIYIEVHNSVIGSNVVIGKGSVIRDSIIMNQTQIGEGCEINKAIIAENVVGGNQVKLGVGEEAENDTAPHIYNHGLVTIGEKSVIPDGISVGKNSVISGVTAAADYEDSQLASGKTLIKAGE